MALLAGMMVIGTAGTASADGEVTNQNHPAYYEQNGYGDCTKGAGGGTSHTLGAPPSGQRWTLLVVKAGSEHSNPSGEDRVLYPNPTAGQAYDAPASQEGGLRAASFVIYCSDLSQEPKVVKLNLTYMVDCDLKSNRWRVRNPSETTTVVVTYGAYGSGETKTHEATPGDSFFETPYRSETMVITWGDGESVAKGKVTKASGGNASDCGQPEVVKLKLKLTYMEDCDLEFNRWRVRNPSETTTVAVTYGAYGSGETKTHEATPGDSFFETPYRSETMIITWGDDKSVAKGQVTKASGRDTSDCGPTIPTKPNPGSSATTVSTVNCVSETVTTRTTTVRWDYSWDGKEWDRVETVTPVVDSRPATAEELNQAGCPGSDRPGPRVEVIASDEIRCDAYEVVTTTVTTTTTFEYVEEDREWVELEPVMTTEEVTRKANDRECPPEVKGEETEGPKPQPAPGGNPQPNVGGEEAGAPTVAGVAQAVPTAVDAGLGAVAPTGAASAGTLIGQGLVGGGLVLLLLAGWRQRGRIAQGAHQL